ncbi:ATP-binding protein [Acididesulfobacillus acetoxydans]|uniref:ATP-binding protein n=1 Tax=Acididesulfobacillus acetoxydans TaxID=1561005 RepID=UPI0035561E5D
MGPTARSLRLTCTPGRYEVPGSNRESSDFSPGRFKDTLYKIDLGKLERVLDNVVCNSLEYLPDGGSITIKAEEESREIRFEISDLGPGFDSKMK